MYSDVVVVDPEELNRELPAGNKGNAKSKGKGKAKPAANTSNKNRGKIFTTDEVDCLLSLIDKYKDIVECKITDGKTWEEKRAQWEKITREFNACGFSGLRTSSCLQNKWSMLKGQTRKALSAERKTVKATGGGEYRAIKMTPQLEVVARICAEESMTGELESPDNDSSMLRAPAHSNTIMQRTSQASMIPSQSSCSLSALLSSRETAEIQTPRNVSSSSRRTISLASTSSQSCSPPENQVIVEADFSDDCEEHDTFDNLIREEEYNDAHDMQAPESVPATPNNWSSYTPAMLRGPKSAALISKETPRKRKNNHRSYDLHNENLDAKKRIITLQEEYYKSLVRLQEKDEEIKIKEMDYRRRALEMKEERHALKMSKIKELYDMKMNNEEKLYRLKLNCVLRESQKGNRGQEN